MKAMRGERVGGASRHKGELGRDGGMARRGGTAVLLKAQVDGLKTGGFGTRRL